MNDTHRVHQSIGAPARSRRPAARALAALLVLAFALACQYAAGHAGR